MSIVKFNLISIKSFFALMIFMIINSSGSYAQIEDKAEDICPLLIGETIPNAVLLDAEGNDVKLKTIISQMPSVLVFYRGGWCPYCNKQLSGLAAIEKDIIKLGYQIIAISPDEFLNLKNTEETDTVHYQLFSDPQAKLIQDIGIAYKTPLMAKAYISAKTKGKVTDILPVPTIMIIDKNGEIQFEYINPNYKKRLSTDLLLSVLNTLNKE